MGTRDILPPDLLKEMEASGVKFDENGEIIDPNQFLSDVDDDSSNEEEDQSNAPDEDDQEDDSEDQEDDSSEDDDESDDQEEDEEEEEEKPAKKTAKKVDIKPRFKLTPKSNKSDDDSDNEVADLRRQLKELEAKIKAPVQSNDDEDDTTLASTLRREVSQFRKMRMKEFASSVESTINTMYPETSFQEIITSVEWQDYQNSRVMGARVGDLYITTIKSEEKDEVVSFFSDFVDRYLPSLTKAKPVAAAMKKTLKPNGTKPKLEDQAIPEKAKATNGKPKRSGFDFTTSDYNTMLDKAQRGQISVEEFTKFEDRFLKAEREGRVKDE